jgi:tRNA 2-thiouridine synthesizing protein C
MKSVFYILDSAPYGSEKALEVLSAAAVSLSLDIALGLYGDGVYLALAGQSSKALDAPNLEDLIYAYPELRVLSHEPSMFERRLLGERLIENIELADDEDFLAAIEASESVILL